MINVEFGVQSQALDSMRLHRQQSRGDGLAERQSGGPKNYFIAPVANLRISNPFTKKANVVIMEAKVSASGVQRTNFPS
jgi:hypothetical protein